MNQFISSLSKSELLECVFALNAHAIVAVTDQFGVITEVNDLFCKISKYTKGELCGSTHKIVNSGYHEPAFFKELWHTIKKGKIWQGEICNRAKDGSIYWVYSTIVPFLNDKGEPYKYIAIRADITKLKNMENEARRLSLQDELTGLYNRRFFYAAFIESQEKSMKSNQYCALISIDVDDFKRYNDSFGHAYGDQVLTEVASRLKKCARNSASIIRMGGDEFFIILNELGCDLKIATSTVKKIGINIINSLSQPKISHNYNISFSSELSISASLGCRIYKGKSHSIEDIMMSVDSSLYKSKKRGKGNLHIYDE